MTISTSSTFEPDWRELCQAGKAWPTYIDEVIAIITEYRRQLAASGWVIVSAEDAQTAGLFALDAFKATYTNGTTDVLDAVYDCCFRVYEAGRAAARRAADGEKS